MGCSGSKANTATTSQSDGNDEPGIKIASEKPKKEKPAEVGQSSSEALKTFDASIFAQITIVFNSASWFSSIERKGLSRSTIIIIFVAIFFP